MKIKWQIHNLLGRFSNIPNPAVNESCAEFEVDNWVLSRFIINQIAPIVTTSPFPLNEMLLMTGAICRFKPVYVFEWGTHLGKSARIFAETGKKFSIPVEIHSTDLPDHVFHEEHPGNMRGKFVKHFQSVFLHQGDGLSTSLDIARSIDKSTQTLFFLDGDHAYASVLRELTGIMTEFPTANILVHDTFYQSPQANYNIGPYLAIQAALEQVPNTFRSLSTNTGLPGMTLLYHG